MPRNYKERIQLTERGVGTSETHTQEHVNGQGGREHKEHGSRRSEDEPEAQGGLSEVIM